MSRIARIVYEGYPHHIVQRGNNRQTIFLDEKDRWLYLNLLKKYSCDCHCLIQAYCLMPNHVHLLAVPNETTSLAKMMQKLSLRYTQNFNKKYRRTGRLWECRFYSSLVDHSSYLLHVCRYIERNPVRAKLVKTLQSYRWSSAYILFNDRNSFIKPIWPKFISRVEYLQFIGQEDIKDELTNIRKSSLRGFPIGSKNFIKKIEVISGTPFLSRKVGRPFN